MVTSLGAQGSGCLPMLAVPKLGLLGKDGPFPSANCSWRLSSPCPLCPAPALSHPSMSQELSGGPRRLQRHRRSAAQSVARLLCPTCYVLPFQNSISPTELTYSHLNSLTSPRSKSIHLTGLQRAPLSRCQLGLLGVCCTCCEV